MNAPQAPEPLLPDLYRILVPLPNNPLKYTNSYVITGKDRFLVVDTGLNRNTCKTALTSGLEALGADFDKTDFLITHLHADHYALAPVLASPKSRIYFSRPDAKIMETWKGFGFMLDYAAVHGFPKARLEAALNAHPGHAHGVETVPAFTIINDGDILEAGPYEFIVMETPGHSPGHVCLYEPKAKILVAGDHVLRDITPNIQCWRDGQNPLESYLESLDRVRDLAVDMVLPGHRRIFSDLKVRVDELKAHHKERLGEVAAIVAQNGPVCAYDTAGAMKWDLAVDKWENFPVAQQWFATGEAISHLRYLEMEKKITARSVDGKIFFANV